MRIPFSRRVLAAAAAPLLAAACGRGPAAPAPQPNVLLIVSDALRADALSCYGGRARTPEICGLAERGVLFESARAAAPWTLPSVAALAGGNYPAAYARGATLGEGARVRIPETERLLGEALLEGGYDAVAYIENPIARQGNAWQGLRLRHGRRAPENTGGDGELPAHLRVDLQSPAYRKLIEPLGYLARPAARPFYLVVWILDPHAPYRPPPRHLAALADQAARLPRPLDYYLGLGQVDEPDKGERRLRAELPHLSAAEVDFLRQLYLKEVESVDERVGHLLQALAFSGRSDSTYVVFTADHGEGFGEHGSYLHAETLYEEAVRVPWILAGPGLPRGARRSEPVSLVDLMPTLSDLLAAPCLEDPQGRSLRPLLGAQERSEWARRPTYLSDPLRNPDLEGVVRGHHKLIRSRDRFFLYDLEADPAESRDLSAAAPDLLAELRSELARLRGATLARQAARLGVDGPTPAADEETRRQLRALGYLD